MVTKRTRVKINTRCSLIKHEDARLAEKSACEAEELALAHGKVRAILEHGLLELVLLM